MVTKAVSTSPATTATISASTTPVMIGSKPSLVPVPSKTLSFLIMDAPRPNNLHLYIKEFRKHHVTDVVRVCDPTYPAAGLESAGISLHELPYDDGQSPPKDVLDKWLKLVGDKLKRIQPPSTTDFAPSSHNGSLAAVSNCVTCIAVHCVAGLGRAPVLVAIALIEFAGMDYSQAVTLIRKHRRGAINGKQLNWLEKYKRSNKTGTRSGGCCAMM